MPLKDEHYDRIHKAIRDAYFGNEVSKQDLELTAETKLTDPDDGLALDDLDMVEIVMDLESAFNISIDDEVYGDLKTLGDLYRVVDERL